MNEYALGTVRKWSGEDVAVVVRVDENKVKRDVTEENGPTVGATGVRLRGAFGVATTHRIAVVLSDRREVLGIDMDMVILTPVTVMTAVRTMGTRAREVAMIADGLAAYLDGGVIQDDDINDTSEVTRAIGNQED
ncbi:hypothetical protein PPTG_06791 [Phytophthora nicotianae INRA-310]|uniref:Uncharacterized protein n=1 Tax=Phytophthora nicotianae (strain INRA-310) TaxID=761204 RepID=W2QTD4_PHYN3|nr:hypothetical protein PPTG_06791 [Phytophthora nicotianae INRA-310]ETN15540.1 hypothetical protein PPTG_06791 [Phytophthora nicotianae INRA-310]